MTTTEVETVSLGDVPRDKIDRITWVGFSGKPYFVDRRQFGGFIWRFKSTPVQKLDGHWHSVEPEFPYRSFSVFMKP